MDAVIQDLRFTLRTLRKTPGFAATVVLTLALGIGSNLAIFGAVKTVLMRPLGIRDPERLCAKRYGEWTGIRQYRVF
jgi:hypothetical protein